MVPAGVLSPSDGTAQMELVQQVTKGGGEKSAVGKTPMEEANLQDAITRLLCVSQRR